MAFDYQQFLKGYKELCAQVGAHPENGISQYQAANHVATKRKEMAWANYDRWWHNPLLWREWRSTEQQERPVEEQALLMMYRGTRLHVREMSIPSNQRNIRLSLREIHRRRGVEMTQINVALPSDKPEYLPTLTPIPGYPQRSSEADYLSLSYPVVSKQIRQHRAWKINKVAAEYFPQGS